MRIGLTTSIPTELSTNHTLVTIVATIVFPFTLLGDLFGFTPLPVSILLLMVTISVLYIMIGEVVKGVFTSV
jgi:hypothetical protein